MWFRIRSSIAIAALTAPMVMQAQRASEVTPSERRGIEAAREAVWRAWFAGDTARLATLIGPTLAAGDDTTWTDRADEFRNSRAFAANGRLVSLAFDGSEFSKTGPLVVVTSHYRLVLETAGRRSRQSGTATEIFIYDAPRKDWVNPFWYLQPAAAPLSSP